MCYLKEWSRLQLHLAKAYIHTQTRKPNACTFEAGTYTDIKQTLRILLHSRKVQCNTAHNCTGLDLRSTWSASLFNPFMLCGEAVLYQLVTPSRTVASMYTWLLVCLCTFCIYSVHSVMSLHSSFFGTVCCVLLSH